MTSSYRSFGRASVCALVVSLTCFSLNQVIIAGNPSSSDTLFEKLSSGDYNDRLAAIRAFEDQRVAEGARLLNTDDAETLGAITRIALFDQRFELFLLEATKWPVAQRTAAFSALQIATVVPLRAKLFSDISNERIAGIQALAAIKNPEIDALLVYFLHDEALQVSLSTMEAAWDRPASETLVDALWRLAVTEDLSKALASNATRPNLPAVVTFRGQQMHGRFTGPIISIGVRDRADILAAIQLLNHFQGPLVESHLNTTLKSLNDRLRAPDDKPPTFFALSGTLDTLAMIGEACKFKSSIAPFYALATVQPKANQIMPRIQMGGLGGPMPYLSIRTAAIATVLVLSGQEPTTYGMTRSGSGVLTFGSADDEQHAVDKLQIWQKGHSELFANRT